MRESTAVSEKTIRLRDAFRDRITIVETRMAELYTGQKRIEDKLDRLLSAK